jgi:hypothetical protein
MMTQHPSPLADLTDLPRRIDRNTAAELVTKYFFPVASRSLEVWPVTWRFINGKAVAETAELFAVAQAKLAAAPLIPSTRRRRSPQTPGSAGRTCPMA